MCFGGTPSYTKKEYGPLPSLGTGRTDETPIAPTAVEAPVTRGGDGGSSSTLDETIARARASRSAGSVRPKSRPSSAPKGSSLLKRSYLSITSPFMRG